uniref:Uncharacterized protein n=1 Tax=Oryza nivara TaxID=4536 RepID=A0A0E0J467_ORYNI
MVDPLTIAAVGWGISTVGWVISPIVAKLVNAKLDKLKKLLMELKSAFYQAYCRLQKQILARSKKQSPQNKVWNTMTKGMIRKVAILLLSAAAACCLLKNRKGSIAILNWKY